MNLFFNSEQGNITLFIAILFLLFITIINIIFLIKNNKKVAKYQKLYEETLSKFNSTENIKDEFVSIYNRILKSEQISENAINSYKKLEDIMKKNMQKIGLVKYNAYDETDNKLSFAFSLLDNNDDGIIINHTYSKHGSNIYAKMVQKGEVNERISEEEALSLKTAKEDKEYLERKLITINSSNMNRIKQKNNQKIKF